MNSTKGHRMSSQDFHSWGWHTCFASFSNWPIDSPPKMASWRTSFVGPSIVFTCQSCLCKSLSSSPSPIIGQWYYNGSSDMAFILLCVFRQAMRKLWKLGQKGGLSIGQLLEFIFFWYYFQPQRGNSLHVRQ